MAAEQREDLKENATIETLKRKFGISNDMALKNDRSRQMSFSSQDALVKSPAAVTTD